MTITYNNKHFILECTINVNGGLGEPQPLIISPGTTDWILPQGRNGIIPLNTGDVIELFCTTSVMATCQSNGQFLIEGVSMDFVNFTCPSYPSHSARRSGRTCYGGATVIEVGYAVDTRFLTTMDICHDEINEATLYSHYHMSEANDGFQYNFPRPNFIPGIFFNGKNVDNLYTKLNQIAVFTNILGSADLANALVEMTGNTYLARGHLAAKADYIFGTHQQSTFYFVNVAPQWQTFNAANWENVESSVRLFAADRGLDLDIYTGTHGIMTAADINGIQRELFVYIDANGKGLIPVPKLYYRVVIDEASRKGIVLLGVNNPHANLAEIQASYIICTDISDQLTWLKWDKTNLYKGYSYACEFNQFAALVGHLPALSVSGVLL